MKPLLYILGFTALTATFLLAADKASAKATRVITLTERNTVSLALPISGVTANDVQQQLLALADQSSSTPIYLVLNSPGGSIDDGKKIIETARGLKQPVHTVSIFAASMAFVIAQLLGDRYIVESGTLMAHPAFAHGMSGQVPGTLVSRMFQLMDDVGAMSNTIAVRAGLSRQEYERIVQNELWLNSSQALDAHFADEIVRLRCDKTLRGPGAPKKLQIGPVTIKVTFHKCPLITEPLGAEVDGESASLNQIQELLRAFNFNGYNVKANNGW